MTYSRCPGAKKMGPCVLILKMSCRAMGVNLHIGMYETFLFPYFPSFIEIYSLTKTPQVEWCAQLGLFSITIPVLLVSFTWGFLWLLWLLRLD